MGRDRMYDKKPINRLKKDGVERKRRQKTQLKRLIALGMPEAVANKMDAKAVRDILKYPAKVPQAVKLYTGGTKK
ncbi:MAG: hypothetical protein A2283_00890 [Lentisphaerae bacterium RIFOXYA12_FULL_48_11]|nr:MAG: hypothetical protein A2283_00890 [Lentisphaerae bacterium RIFOXYA12_FULL_48_11]